MNSFELGCVPSGPLVFRRASIIAGAIVPVGKETDRHWEQGEDISLVDFQVLEYRNGGKLVICDESLRERISKSGIRELMRKTKLSQKSIYALRRGQPVRKRTLAIVKAGTELT
jgi:hypothetical protein